MTVVRRPPVGREGGDAGLAGDQYAVGTDGTIRALPPKAANLRLDEGETLVLTTSGGGGLGDPHQREPERVAEDVAEGNISAEAARERYGREVSS